MFSYKLYWIQFGLVLQQMIWYSKISPRGAFGTPRYSPAKCPARTLFCSTTITIFSRTNIPKGRNPSFSLFLLILITIFSFSWMNLSWIWSTERFSRGSAFSRRILLACIEVMKKSEAVAGRNTLQYMHHNSELENVLIQTFSMSIFGRLLLFFLSILQYFQTTTIIFVGINHLRPRTSRHSEIVEHFPLGAWHFDQAGRVEGTSEQNWLPTIIRSIQWDWMQWKVLSKSVHWELAIDGIGNCIIKCIRAKFWHRLPFLVLIL